MLPIKHSTVEELAHYVCTPPEPHAGMHCAEP